MKKLNHRVNILFLLLFSIGLKGQTIGLTVNKPKPATEQGLARPPQYPTLKKHFPMIANSISVKKIDLLPNKIPSIFSVETLPFFCKIEYKMGLNKKLPLKFRLGDVQYVDELEGKKH